MGDLIYNLLLIFIAAVVILCTSVYLFLKKRYKFWQNLGIPGPEPKLPFGNTAPLINMEMTDAEFTDSLYKKFRNEDYIGYYNVWKPVLLVVDRYLVKRVMESDFEYFEDRPGINPTAHSDSIMINLFSLRGRVWKSRRAAFSRLFTPKKSKEYFEDMQASLYYLMQDFEDKVGQDCSLEEIVKNYAVRVICMEMYGLDLSKDKERISKFVEYANIFSRPSATVVFKMMMSAIVPFIFKIFRLSIFPSSVYNYFSNLTDEMVALRKTGKVVRNDLLDMIMKMKEEGVILGEKMSVGEAVGHIYTFFQASFDTTELSICHCLLQLALNPEVQEKARKEVDRVLKGSETITFEQLSEMNYIDAILCESLRMIPPVGTYDRVCTKPYKIDDKFTIPKGMMVHIPTFSVQNDPINFPEPEKFKPERFYDNVDGVKDYWIPFGSGPRICVGMRIGKMSVKLVLAKTLSKYLVLASDKMTIPMKYDPQTFVFTSRPINGFWIKLQKRDGIP